MPMRRVAPIASDRSPDCLDGIVQAPGGGFDDEGVIASKRGAGAVIV
jgi:hypothetical protein